MSRERAPGLGAMNAAGTPSADPRNLLIVGLRSPELEAEDRQLLDELRPGGVILYARNLSTPQATTALIHELRRLLGPTALVLIDQEGGRVDRLRRWAPSCPSAMALGAAGSTSLSKDAGRRIGDLLRLLGVDMNLAPLVDLAMRREDNIIGTRSFGPKAAEVVKHAGSFMAGLTGAGVHACLKHFPGLGSAEQDPHLSLPVLPLRRSILERGELAVYRTLSHTAGAVLVGHGYYPNLTRRGIEPASLSPEVVSELLKGELAFSGAVLSDDLTMDALALEEPGAAAVKALAAGCDLLLVGSGADAARGAAEALELAWRAGAIKAERLQDACTRVTALRGRREQQRSSTMVDFDPQAFEQACEAMGELAERVARRAATRLHGKTRLPKRTTVVLRPKLPRLEQEQERHGQSPFREALTARGLEVDERVYDLDHPEAVFDTLEVDSKASVLLVSHSTSVSLLLLRTADRLSAAGANVFHMALGLPVELGAEHTQAEVATYGCGWEAVRAGLDVLSGKLKARGRAPLLDEFVEPG